MYCSFWKLDKFVCFIDVIITNIKNNQLPHFFLFTILPLFVLFCQSLVIFFVSLIMPSIEEK